MKFYRAFDVNEETPVQYVAVHPLRWRPEWGEPAIMFREVDDKTQALTDAAPDLLDGLVRAEQTIRNLAAGMTGDDRVIALNEAANLRRDIAKARGDREEAT